MGSRQLHRPNSFRGRSAPDRGRLLFDLSAGVERLEPRLPLAAGVTPPPAPTNLSATAVSASEIGLAWELPADGDTAVVVERRGSATEPFVPLVTLPGGETIFTDTGCWAGAGYSYRVKVRAAAGESDYSPAVTATALGVSPGAYAAAAGLAALPRSATAAEISFVDTNAGGASYLVERSADGVAYAVVATLQTATNWRDTGLEPGGEYRYRVRAVGWQRPTSDYSPAVRLVMPTRTGAAPVEPAGVTAAAVSATAVRVSWSARDSAASHAIERSEGYDPWHPIAWRRVAVAAAGVTSFVDTGLDPETPYAYRVIAVRGGRESDPGAPAADVMHALFGAAVGVVTASAGSGARRTYDIGPGRPLSRLSDLDWSRLGPGDTVNVHCKPGGYRELLQIASRGTADAWITVNGVPDPVTGELPVIDARDAVLAPQFRNHYAPVDGSGAIVVGARPGFRHGYKPGYLSIRNLDVRNCHSSSGFTDSLGVRRRYGFVGAGIYLERCDHVTIAGCAIHDNGEGIFGAGQSDFDRLMTDVTVDGNRIWGNGNAGRDREHNTYLEAIDTVYQFNRYGPLRSGALGAGLKDRSVGTVIRFNWIEGGAHQLQLPEAQNQADLAVVLPRYRGTVIEGNTLVAPPGHAASIVWVGGDQGLTPWYRKGVVSLVHNTLVSRSDRSQVWKITAIEAASAGEAIDARNNIICALPATPGGSAPELAIVGRDNRVSFGRNWASGGARVFAAGEGPVAGAAAGVANIVGGAAADPGFVDAAGGDYRLAAGSACVDAAGPLPARLAAHPVGSQFRPPAGAAARPVIGRAADLGSFESGVAVAPPGPPSRPPLMAPATPRAVALSPTQVRLSWIDRSRDETGFVVERWRAGGTWERVGTTAANAVAFVDRRAAAGTSYAYRVRAASGPPGAVRLSAATAVVWVRTPSRGRSG